MKKKTCIVTGLYHGVKPDSMWRFKTGCNNSSSGTTTAAAAESSAERAKLMRNRSSRRGYGCSDRSS